MKKTTLVAGVCAVLASFGGNLVVNEPTTLSVTADYDNAEIHADLSVDSQASVAITGSVVSVGSEVGEKPVIAISGKASLLTQHLKPGGSGGNAAHWLWPSCTIGANGGTAKFVVANSQHMSHSSAQRPTTGLGLWLGGVTVAENAAVNNAEDDTIDLLQLDKDGYADIAALTNLNAKTVRILFNGGKLRMHYAGTRGSIANYCPAGKTIEYHSVDGNDIYLYKVYYGVTLISGGGTFKTSGDGDFVVSEEGYVEGSNKCNLNLSNANGTHQWNHKGDLRLEWGGILKTCTDNVLPYGAGTGIVRLKGTNESIYPDIDLNGTSQKINGLVTTGASFVSNRTTKAASIVLGDSDYDGGRLSAKIFGKVSVRKQGAGSITIDGTTAPELAVEAGTATVNGDSNIDTVTVSEGASLVVDGATLTCANLTAAAESVRVLNGGKIVLKVGTAEKEWLWSDFPADVGTVVKSGSGEYVYHGTNALDKSLRVDEGRFTFSGRWYCTNEWWRLSLKRPYVNNYAQMELAEWSIFQYEMPENIKLSYYNYRAMGEVVYNAQDKDPKELANSEVTISNGPSPDGWLWKIDETAGKEYRGPVGLFDSKGYGGLLVTNGNFGTTETDPSRWVVLTLRIRKNRPVGSYALSNNSSQNYVRPRAWKLETSPDGEVWQTADEVSMPSTPDKGEYSDGFWNYGRPYTFTQLTMEKANGIASSALVSVASGATLDLDYTPDANAEIGALEYDLANGGGTITKFIPAETGNLNLVGAKPAYGDLTLSYTFGTVKNAANLANWTVSLNGEAMDNYRAEIVDGKLVVHVVPKGLMIILR